MADAAPAVSTSTAAAPAPVLPTTSALPDLEGTLKKIGKGMSFGNPWKVRQFKQQREKLFYYKAGSKNPKGHIDLSKVSTIRASTNGGPFGLTLVTPTREWQLQAENELAQRYWIDGLTAWIETAPKMPASPRSVSPRPGAKEPLRNPSPMPRNVSPQKELPPRPTSPQKESRPGSVSPQKMSDAAVKTDPMPRAVSPNRLSLNKELPPIPAPRPGSPNKRNSVSPTKGGDRAAEPPAPQELKDLLVKLDDKVRSAARYLVDEQSSLWVQNLDNVEITIREVKETLASQSKLMGAYMDGRKAQEQHGMWCEKTQELLVKKRTRAAVSQMKATIAFRQSMLPMSVEKKRTAEAEGHMAAIREALNDNAELLETSSDLKGFRDAVLASLKELSAKLGPSALTMEEEKPEPEVKKVMEEKRREEKKPELEMKKVVEGKKPEPAPIPIAAPIVAPIVVAAPVDATPPPPAAPGDDGRARATTAMELAELERQQRELENDQRQLDAEQKALEDAHNRHSHVLDALDAPKALGISAAATGAPAISAGGPIEELASAIAAVKPITDSSPAQHNAIFELFNGLEMHPAAVDQLVAGVKVKGQTLTRLTDEEFGKMPDAVERPRGPADYFRLVLPDGKQFYVVVASGAPYLLYTPI